MRELRQRGIPDERVLAAIGAVPRHLFFEPAFEEHAYQDKAFPIGEGQTISQPYTVAYQTAVLGLAPGQRVLEMGTGSGYQCAVLLQLTPHVHSIEFSAVLFARTRQPPGRPGGRRGRAALWRRLAGPARGRPTTASSSRLARRPCPRPCCGSWHGRAAGDSGGRRQTQRMVRVTREGPESFRARRVRRLPLCAPARGRRLAS